MGVARPRIARAVRMAFLLAAVSPLAATAAFAADSATSASDGSVHFGNWGVDLNSRDPKVRPGDDFERFASGAWMDANEIPADKSQNGVGSEVNDRNQERLREIVTGAPADSQLGAFYRSYMDEARLEQLDTAPLKADLARVDAIGSKADFARFMAASLGDFGTTLFGPGQSGDQYALSWHRRAGPARSRLLPARQV
jgi:putative endopeptidase